MTTRRRPRQIITITVPPDLVAEADRLAEQRDVSRSRITVVALREYLERQRAEQRPEFDGE